MSGIIGSKIASQVSTPNEKITVGDISEPIKTQEGKVTKEKMSDIVGKIKDAVDKPIKSGKANAHIDFGIGDDPFKNFTLIDPKATVENIRNAKGNNRDIALLGFEEKIDHMGTKDLKSIRDYLVKEMSSPTNKDDQLLGSMLNMVNHKLDEKGNDGSIIRILETKAGDIHKDPMLKTNIIDSNSNIEKKFPSMKEMLK